MTQPVDVILAEWLAKFANLYEDEWRDGEWGGETAMLRKCAAALRGLEATRGLPPDDRLAAIKSDWAGVQDGEEPMQILEDVAWLITEVERLRGLDAGPPPPDGRTDEELRAELQAAFIEIDRLLALVRSLREASDFHLKQIETSIGALRMTWDALAGASPGEPPPRHHRETKVLDV